MTAPNLSISVEPSESSAVVYGALAGKSANDPPGGQLSLILTIKNNETVEVHMNQVAVSFAGTPPVASSSIAADLTLVPAETKKWYFAPANNIILPIPSPDTVELALAFDGFSDPATVSMPLAVYVCPAEDGGYSFPASTDDLASGEYWTGRSASHGSAGGGTQLFAYDMGVQAFNPATNSWSTSKPGAENSKNESYYVWGKPIYAMADGVVVQFLDGVAANTPPNKPSPTPSPVEGNHFYIQHGSDLALYAHFQAGTLNPVLTSGPNQNGTGAAVQRGQLLGLAGNSGNSSGPHLHIQVNRTTKPWGGPTRPLPFNGIHVLELSAVDTSVWPPNADSAWNAVAGQALPNALSAIWPGKLSASKFILKRWFYVLAWAWIIFMGGLMITPGGIECVKCGPLLTRLLGAISVAAGSLGLFFMIAANRKGTPVRPRIEPERDMHA